MSPQFDKALDLINKMASDLGIFPSKQKSDFLYWEHPKDWDKTIYRFGYTPWRTTDPDTGKTGFWALKYRYLKTKKQWKLVKKVRFGRRKIATQRAYQWHQKYYHPNSGGT